MNIQYRKGAENMLCVILIMELVGVAVEAKIRDHTHHHDNLLLRRLHRHGHKHHRRGADNIEGEITTEETAKVIVTSLTELTTEPSVSSDSVGDAAERTIAQPTEASNETTTDSPTTTTESSELALEAKQLGAKIEKEMDECETVRPSPEVDYTPPSMPPHIDTHYFHVTQRVPYYTVGPVDPIGYDPPVEKLTSCEKLYRKHLRDELYFNDTPETEESLEITRLPRDKKKREKVLRDMFEFSDEMNGGDIKSSSEIECRRRSH